jgi:hypothetical protein
MDGLSFTASSLVFVILAGGVGGADTRPGSDAYGVILSKTFKGATTYTQTHTGPNRGFQRSTDIPIGEAYGFEVRIEGLSQIGRVSLNTVAAKQFEVGQRVKVRYEYRTLFLFVRRLFIVDMQPA